ncbi:MAG: hypothetical protein ACI4F0_11420 [Agathobacter sp.]
MIREGEEVYFTEEDKKNLYIKKYTAKELKTKEMQYKKKQNKRRSIFLLILVTAILLAIFVKSVAYPSYIVIVFMIFLIVLYEDIDRTDIKAVRRKYYFEVLVEEKFETENIIVQTLSPGTNVSTFYPVRGRVIENDYVSIFYLEREEYEDCRIGETVKISVKGDKL